LLIQIAEPLVSPIVGSTVTGWQVFDQPEVLKPERRRRGRLVEVVGESRRLGGFYKWHKANATGLDPVDEANKKLIQTTTIILP
jgi:hypothetical protein